MEAVVIVITVIYWKTVQSHPAKVMEKCISNTGLDVSRKQDVAIMEKTTSCFWASETEAQRNRSWIQAVSTSVIMHDYPTPPQDSGLSRMGSLSCTSQQSPENCRRKTRPWWSCHCCQLITPFGGRELWYWCHYWSHRTMTRKINLNEIRWQQTCCGTTIDFTGPNAIP